MLAEYSIIYINTYELSNVMYTQTKQVGGSSDVFCRYSVVLQVK